VTIKNAVLWNVARVDLVLTDVSEERRFTQDLYGAKLQVMCKI
jgi:hypothetical protein